MSVLTEVSRLPEVEADWRSLAVASHAPFCSPDWYLAWIRHFGRGARPAVVLVRDDDRLRGVLPLVDLGWRRAGMLGTPGPELCDDFRPVVDGISPEVAGAAAGAAIRRWGGLKRGVRLDHVDERDGWSYSFAAQAAARQDWPRGVMAHPVIELGESGFEGYFAARSRNLRRSVERGRRRLAERGAVSVRSSEGSERVDDDISAFFRLHCARASTAGIDTEFARPDVQAFYRDFLRASHDLGWLRLVVIEVDGQPVAANVNWRLGQRLICALSGFDPDWADCSPGIIAELENVRLAAAEGVMSIDLGAGGHDYKRRLATTTRSAGLTIVSPRLHPVRVATRCRARLGAVLGERSRRRLRGIGRVA